MSQKRGRKGAAVEAEAKTAAAEAFRASLARVRAAMKQIAEAQEQPSSQVAKQSKKRPRSR